MQCLAKLSTSIMQLDRVARSLGRSIRDGDGGGESTEKLVRKTAELAAEVASLARDLEEKQARLQKRQVCHHRFDSHWHYQPSHCYT